MSLAYCYECLKRIDECECERCGGACDEVVYGDRRVAYLEGYRDAQAGKEENV